MTGSKEARMAKRDGIKPRGYPDRRGMGAQSDFIAEQFAERTVQNTTDGDG